MERLILHAKIEYLIKKGNSSCYYYIIFDEKEMKKYNLSIGDIIEIEAVKK